MNIFFHDYVDSSINAVADVISIFKTGKNIAGWSEKRVFLLGNQFIMNIFYDNKLFGTGFDNLWRTKEGDDLGYEATDYPFQSALAMSGLFGVLLFSPIYYYLIKMLFKDIRTLKQYSYNKNELSNNLHISLIVWFIYQLIQYVNWFSPISMTSQYQWFVELALFISVRQSQYVKIS